MNAVQEQRAKARARNLYRSSGFQGAYLRGAHAAHAGATVDACPYRSRGGWAAWRRAWLRGYRSIA